ncbi:MAG: TonB-dependent receptor [Thermodesulfobacteriota bacterium]
MRTNIRISILSVIMVLSFCILSYAQASSAIVEGIVEDDTGQALRGAIITLANIETGWNREIATAGNGSYRIEAIPPGKYEITVMLGGFATQIRKGITLYVGQVARLNFVLKMAAVEETITVTAEAPIVETTKSEIGQVVEQTRIESLPLDGRNFLELAELAPGVAPSTGFGGGGTSISAASFRNVTFNIDGLEVTDVVTRGGFGYFTAEPVREFEVITNRFSAEYARSLSGVVNVITKSGTNDLHATAYVYARDEVFDARRWYFDYDKLDFVKEKEKENFSFQQFGFSIGGPLAKNKTHFFLNYEGARYNSTAYVTANPAWSLLDISDEIGSFPVTTRTHQIFAKINHQFSPRNYLTVGFSFKKDDHKNLYVGGLSTQSFGCSLDWDEYLLLVSETFTVSDRAVNEFRFQFGTRRQDWIPNDKDPAVYEYTTYGVICSSGSHPSVDQLNFNRRIQFKDDFSISLPQTKSGEHHLKFGFDLQFLYGDHDTRYYKNGYYVVWYGTPYYYTQGFGPSHFKFNEEVYGIYIQDDWKLAANFTLNVGVRYDYNSYAPDDNDNIQPRFGFAYDPFNDGKTVLRGGIGWYYDNLFIQILQTAANLGKNGVYIATWLPWDPSYPSDWKGFAEKPEILPVSKQSIWACAPDMKIPHSIQYSVGISRELLKDLSLSLDGVLVRGKNLLRLRDANAPASNWRDHYSFEIPRGWETYYADFYRPDGNFRIIHQMETTGRSEYKALYVSLTKRYSNNFSFQASYTLAEAKDDIPMGGDYNNLPNDSNDMDAEWGYSLNDLRHVFALNGVYYLPYGFSVGGIFIAYSGRPYSASLGYDYNGNGVFDRPLGMGKNTLRGKDWFKKLDLFVAKSFSLRRYQLSFRLDAFNVLNSLNVGGYGSTVDTLVYQLATYAYSPRELQLSVRFSL